MEIVRRPFDEHSMSTETWSAVDRYITDLFVSPDPALAAALAASVSAGLPEIQVSPSQGKFLHLLARIQGARRILELGTLGGYSSIWLARALPVDGRLITLESNPAHADVARANVARAALGSIVEVRLGSALDTLPQLVSEGCGPFDLSRCRQGELPRVLPLALETFPRGNGDRR